jgi:hypothetical protein
MNYMAGKNKKESPSDEKKAIGSPPDNHRYMF